ncbi:hypothetical protein SAMN06296386_101392 [Lachnospiraceae bacterium]|nr:hypothetical protein SAMN06296386_101392 [Lachnospiraceae bacterium]
MRSRSGKVLATILTVAMVVSSAVPVSAEVYSYKGKNFDLIVEDEYEVGDAKQHVHVGTPIDEYVVGAHELGEEDKNLSINSLTSSESTKEKEEKFIVKGTQTITVGVEEMPDTEDIEIEGEYYDEDVELLKVLSANYDDSTPYVGETIDVDDITVSVNLAYVNNPDKTFEADVWDGDNDENGNFSFKVSPEKIEKVGENIVEVTITHDSCTPAYTDDDVTEKIKMAIVAKDPNPIKDNGYTEEQNEALTFGTERSIIKEAKTKKGQTVSLDMALYTAEAVMWNGKPGKFSKKSDKRNNLPIDIDKSKVSVNGVEVEIKAVKIKNTKKAYVSQNSIFARSISEANLAEYKKVEEKGKKLPSYFIQLKAPKGADKDTKKAVSTANKYLKENPVYFEIVPIQLAYDTLTVEMNKKGTKIKKLTSSKAGDAKLKKKTDYKAEIKDNTAIIEGVVNYNGKKVVSLK